MHRLHGIALYLAATLLITAMSAVVRHLSASVSVGQIIFWRSAAALLPIVIYMTLRREFPSALKTSHPGLHVTRSLFGAVSMALSFVSLRYLPVANAQALGYLAPILVLPMAAALAGERLGKLVIGATLLGFTGVLAMIGDSLSTPGRGALLGVAAGLGFAVTMAFVRVHVKTMTRTERPSAIAFYFAVVSAVAGLATLPLGWIRPDGDTLFWLVLAGVLGGMAHIAATEAVARVPVSTLAPLDYTGLLWALGFDILIFQLVPTPLGLGGALAITAAVLAVTLLPQRRASAK